MSDVLETLTNAVAALEDQQDTLLDACTDPQATDMAELLDVVLCARKRLQDVERFVEVAVAKAMTGDMAETPTLRVERHRGTDRKAWEHEAWQRDVRQQVIRKHGLLGAQGVLSADGELLDVGVLHEVLRMVQGVHGSAGPKVTAMRGLGLDSRDYCESSPGAWHVKVLRMADETETTTEPEGAPDAA